MRCPVCDKENSTLLCPDCGFDASRDYEKYPTFGPVEGFKPASALRREKEEARKAADTEQQLLDEIAERKRQLNAEKAEKDRLLKQQDQATRRSAPTSTAPETPRKKSGWLSRLFGSAQEQPPDPNREPNILRQDQIVIPNKKTYDVLDAARYPVFGSKLQREQIETVTFLNTLRRVPASAWDVSAAGNGSVMAWAVPRGTLYQLYIASAGGINGVESCKDLFAGYRNMSRIDFGGHFYTGCQTDMSRMFYVCNQLTEVDLSGFDTSQVQDMSGMFYAANLTSLDLSGFNTSRVQNMKEMFCYASKLTHLDLSCFDTSNVKDMSGMFAHCSVLRSVSIDGFDTSKVESMKEMFAQCYKLYSLNLRKFRTENVQFMGSMFAFCEDLASLDLSSFNTSKVYDMACMFMGCRSLKTLDLSNFDTSKVRSMNGMFSECRYLEKLNLRSFTISTGCRTYKMFEGCPAEYNWKHLLH